ncbi:MAG: hypothetical protein IJH12_00900 [Clostridia bacterium]|nr:hypothetical protein [Clostridia bacterium]
MKGYSMEVKVEAIGNLLPDGRVIDQVVQIGGTYSVLQVNVDGEVDTVFAHAFEAKDEPENVFWGLCFTNNPENAKRLHVCVRSCAEDGFFPDTISEFQMPEKLWDGCYKIQSLTKTYYVKIHP